jgi:membrane-associated progesterone receptor component
LLAIAVAILLHVLMGGGSPPPPPQAAAKDEAEEEPDPPRNFSPLQLRRFDGRVHEGSPKFDLDAGKVRIALKGNVYDVTAGASFYGPGGPYHVFAGRDASRALAKLSFEEADLANPTVDDLTAHEKDQLGDWIAKFEMKRCARALSSFVVIGLVFFFNSCWRQLLRRLLRLRLSRAFLVQVPGGGAPGGAAALPPHGSRRAGAFQRHASANGRPRGPAALRRVQRQSLRRVLRRVRDVQAWSGLPPVRSRTRARGVGGAQPTTTSPSSFREPTRV